MKDYDKILENGVKRIISVRTPSSLRPRKKEFQISTHRDREILFVLSGHSRFVLGNRAYKAEPGTAFLIDRWIPHPFGYRETDRNLQHLWILADQEDISASFLHVGETGGQTFFDQVLSLRKEPAKLLNFRWDLLCQEPDADDAMTEEYLKVPVNVMIDEVRFKLRHPMNQKIRVMEPVIETLKQHIRMSCGRDCSFAKLEQLSGFSRFYIARQFRKQMNCTVGDYIEQVRIDYTASAMLKGLKQKEIGFELGFRSPANFWAWLRKNRTAVEEKRDFLLCTGEPGIR